MSGLDPPEARWDRDRDLAVMAVICGVRTFFPLAEPVWLGLC
jgi:hypothetical protein